MSYRMHGELGAWGVLGGMFATNVSGHHLVTKFATFALYSVHHLVHHVCLNAQCVGGLGGLGGHVRPSDKT